jgi:AcrR family transcriptional regulator
VAGTRERILEAALRCFVARGYEQTTIAEIRAESGVSNGALFHHFPAKEAIADALYLAGIRSFQAGLWPIVTGPRASLLDAVRAVIGHQLAWTEQHPDHARFIYQRGHLDFDTPGGAELSALNRDLATAFRRWMAPLVTAGEIRPMSMLVVTAIVSGPAHALARRWLAGQLSSPLSGHADELAFAACAGLGARVPAGLPGGQAALVSQGRVSVEFLTEDGTLAGQGEVLVQLAQP